MKNRNCTGNYKSCNNIIYEQIKKKNIVVFSVKLFFGCAIHKNDEKIYRKAKNHDFGFFFIFYVAVQIQIIYR